MANAYETTGTDAVTAADSHEALIGRTREKGDAVTAADSHVVTSDRAKWQFSGSAFSQDGYIICEFGLDDRSDFSADDEITVELTNVGGATLDEITVEAGSQRSDGTWQVTFRRTLLCLLSVRVSLTSETDTGQTVFPVVSGA